ncbi:response regulator [bacterium]|nr:response regulator [candidate division CSSED10-310 bacterium]
MSIQRTPRILVVDDEPHVCDLICEVLRRRNYSVDRAGDGREALELFKEHMHDLIIADIRMPVMDGMELLQAVKQIAPLTEIIVMTGHVSRESAAKALDLGAYTYFVKPFECLELIPLLTLKTLEHQNLLRENRRLVETLRGYVSEQQQELVTFEEIVDGLSQMEDPMDLMGLLLRRVGRELRAGGVWCWMVRDQLLLPFHYQGIPGPSSDTLEPIRLGDSVVGVAARTGEIETVEDIGSAGSYPWIVEARRAGVQTVTATPLVYDGHAAGVFCVCFTAEQSAVHRNDDRLVRFSKKIALVLKMIQMVRELVVKNEQVEKAQAMLLQTEQLSAQGMMASGIAHELGGPLGVIGMTTEYLLDSALEMDEVRECLGVIHERVEEMNASILDMLELTRNRAVTFREVDLHPLIERILRFLKQKFRQQNVEVECQFTERMPRIEIDVRKINQVLINLFLNALDAMLPDGKGRLRITTGVDNTGRECTVDVEDTGPGIPESDRRRVFTPFFSKKADGTGLGLAISQQIMNDHGGMITIGSGSDGAGARFTLTLPVRRKDGRRMETGGS